jgi:PEP-CTERM motif-containing protein
MKIVVPALAAAFIATVGASSAAQAALIDFSFVALGNGISASPTPLQDATSLNLDGSALVVSGTRAGDASGLSPGDAIDISPTDIIFTAVSATDPVIKSWTAAIGPDAGDKFTETLTTVTSVDRTSPNAVTWDLTGTVSDTDGLFKGQRVTMIIDATQAGGPGNVISVSGSNSSVIPEPSTWVMMVLGFAGLGYAAVRRSSKDRSALAI